MALAHDQDRAGTESGNLAVGTPLDQFARGVSILADYGFVVALLEGIALLRQKRSMRGSFLRLAVVGISVFALTAILKQLVSKPRPEQAERPQGLVRVPSSSSFPSGHTMAATAAAVALPSTPFGVGAGLTGAGLVGWSRLHLDAHDRTDVIGGAFVGGILGLICRALLRRLAP